MRRLVRMWSRRRRGARSLVVKADRPRRIDLVIDYFGERLAALIVSDRQRRKS